MTDEQGARRAKYVAEVRKAYRDGELTDVQADTLREAGVDLFRNQPLTPGFNDLATVNPVLAAQWHPTKNGSLKPSDILPGSSRKVWWRCEKGHEWEANVSSRASKSKATGCPYCGNSKVLPGFNDLATTNPDLAAQWHPEKNGGLKPNEVMAGSGKKVWWRCEKGHEWQAAVNGRAKQETGCPYCGNNKVLPGFNDLATTNPDLAAQWHPEKNGGLKPNEVMAGSGKKVWWRCEKGHEWQATIANRAKGTGCPYCCGRTAARGVNDLATKRPDLAAQWHPTKNGELTPKDVTAGSKRKVWWRCERGHEWQAAVNGRAGSRATGCPYCGNSKVLPGFNDLATTHPRLAAEWHPTKNGPLTPADVMAGSSRKIWWRCDKGHEWEANVSSRASKSKATGCPECSRVARSKPVRCVENGRLYPGIADAAEAVGLKSGASISKALSGAKKTAGGYHWEYAVGDGGEGESE